MAAQFASSEEAAAWAQFAAGALASTSPAHFVEARAAEAIVAADHLLGALRARNEERATAPIPAKTKGAPDKA